MISAAQCRVAEQRDHHDKEEVARMKQVQVDHGAITLNEKGQEVRGRSRPKIDGLAASFCSKRLLR